MNTMDEESASREPGTDDASELDALFAKARAHPPASDQLADMLRGVGGPSGGRRRLWATGGALVSCAAAIAAAILLFFSPAQPRAFAWSQVVQALREAPVVKCVHADGTTMWERLGHFYAYRSGDDHRMEFYDYDQMRAWTYEVGRGCIMISACEQWPAVYPRTGRHTLDDLIRETEGWGHAFEDRWELSETEADGRRLFVVKAKGGGPYRFHQSIYVDVQTRRVVSAESREGRIEYSYPQTGPMDIYDLGVPRDARVVDGSPPPELMELRAKVLAAQQRGFGAYRMAVVTTVGGTYSWRVISDGQRYRLDGVEFDYSRDWTVDQLRALAKEYNTFDPLDAVMSVIIDEESETLVWTDEDRQIMHRQVTPRAEGDYWSRTLEGQSWHSRGVFFGVWMDQQDEFDGPSERGWLCYRVLGQANNVSRPYLSEWWYDPDHGYLPCAGRGLNFPEADWQIEQDWKAGYHEVWPPVDAPPQGGEGEVLEWGELRPGQWYPAVSCGKSVIQQDDGEWVSHQRTDILNYRPVHYTVISAEPLDAVDPTWFEIPESWLALPAEDLFH
jgi:hypothetical protein